MNFGALSVNILMALSTLLGVNAIPSKMTFWQTTQAWKSVGDYYVYQASSESIVQECKTKRDGFVKFPAVVHGAHVISLDGQAILTFGNPDFKTVHSFYGAPVLSCRQIEAGHKLTWTVTSYTKYFARISFEPYWMPHYPLYNLFAETMHIIGAGSGLIMALFTMIMFFGKVSRALVYSVSAACLVSFFYFASCVSEFFNLSWDMLTAHKVADLSVWVSIGLMFNCFRIEGLLKKKVQMFYSVSIVLAAALIVFGSSGDMIQLGTTFPVVLGMIILIHSMIPLFGKILAGDRDKRIVLQLLSFGSFVTACFNEVFVVTGILSSSPLLPLGFMGGVLFFVFSVNDRVTETYIERDYLRANLESEVQRQTFELQTKSNALEHALVELKTTQAELVQSAKLASLGTLSAGIAHEINNSLNYASGAVGILEKMIGKLPSDFSERSKMEKVMVVMKDGIGLTLEIVKSFRTFTGLNQAKHNDVGVAAVINSSVVLLKNRIRGKIEIINTIDPELKVFGNVVGLNQVFMNLISNAIDAMPKGGNLKFAATVNAGETVVTVSDSGQGIPQAIANRIFDPFFTTKDVGKGTGLGLHIVRNEMDRHHGKVEVQSEENVGTTFILIFPKQNLDTVAAPQAPAAERKAA